MARTLACPSAAVSVPKEYRSEYTRMNLYLIFLVLVVARRSAASSAGLLVTLRIVSMESVLLPQGGELTMARCQPGSVVSISADEGEK